MDTQQNSVVQNTCHDAAGRPRFEQQGVPFFFLFCPPEYSFWSGCHVAVVRSGGTWQKLESHLDIVHCKHPIYSKKLGMDYCQVNVAVVAIFGLDSFFERIWFGFQTKQPTRSTR